MILPPLISTDICGSPSFGSIPYFPPGVTLTVAFFQDFPYTSTPLLLSFATAALARSVRYAPDDAFLITSNCCEIFAVRAKDFGSTIPIPLGDGQISALISFICHFWWPLSSVGPCWRTILTQSAA